MNNLRMGAALLAAVMLAACNGGKGAEDAAGAPPSNTPSTGSDSPGDPVVPARPVLTLARTGSGTLVSSPAGIDCGATCDATFPSNAQVTLSAAPGAGYTFQGWTGGGCSGTATCTVTLSASQTVQADFAPVPVAGTQHVPLTLIAGPAAARSPVRTGVPFPMGAVADPARLRLETSAGAEVPAQFDVIAAWPDGSIKVALAKAVLNLGAQGDYRVAFGPDVSRAAPSRTVKVTGTGTGATEVVVDTGLLQFAVSPKGLAAKVWRDANGDGTYAAAEQVIDAAEMFVVNARDSLEYTASAAPDTVVTVEENGPVRAVVRATGTLSVSGGTHTVKYLLRYYASAGSDKIDIEASIIDDRAESDVQAVPATFAFAAKGMGLRWRYVADGTAHYRFGGEGGAAHEAAVNGEHHLAQAGKFRYVNGEDKGHTFSYSGVGTGGKAAGWMALDSANRHIGLMVKDFWQQFPNELSVDGSTRMITASLFPVRSVGATAQTSAPAPTNADYLRANTLYFARPGGAKTYQLRLAIGADKAPTPELVALNASFQRHRLDLVSTPAWYTSSGVFGDLNPGVASSTTGYNASLLKNIYEPSVVNTDGNATMFGWRDYGDRLRAGWNVLPGDVRVPTFYNDTHVGANNFLTQFVRTGDQRWFELGQIATLHFRDVDVSHGPRSGYWAVNTPAGEIHAINHENMDHQVRNMHWGHAHVSGLSNSYLLTGDKRSYEVLKEIADWWKFVSPTFFKRPFKMADQYREAERDYAWPLYVMNEWVRVSGDATYHKAVAGGLVDYLNQWFRTPASHIGYNPLTALISNTVLATNNAANGTGYWTMTTMDNSGGFNATGTNPWMAGALVGNLIRFHEADKAFTAAGKGSGLDRTQLVDMMLQGMNYIVKYGYDDSRKYFVYSEAIRGYSGGDNHIIYPLAYLDRLYKQEKAAGRLANPGWYDTQAKWGAIAKRRYTELETEVAGSNTQSYGFYGYEIVYPADFFKVVQDSK